MAATSSNNNNHGSTITTNNLSNSNINNNNNNNNNIETDEFIKKSRVTRAAPPKPAYDPLQFVQIKPAKLYDLNKTKPSSERKLELKAAPQRGGGEVEDAEEWQCNLDSWKSSRRKRVEHIIDKITEAKKIEQEAEVCRGRKKSKTFSEMLENSGSRRRFILPDNEDEDEGGSFSDDPQESGDGTKRQYKDESTDERGTDDTSSCCSSKHTDGESKTPDLDLEAAPEMNEFSLAIENYKSKFPMTQGRVLAATTNMTCSSVVSSIAGNGNDNYDDDGVAHVMDVEKRPPTTEQQEEQEQYPSSDGSVEERSLKEQDDEDDNVQLTERQEATPKVNVIERRRLFEQFQQMSCTAETTTTTTTGVPKVVNISTVGTTEDTVNSNYELEPRVPSTEWFAAGGSIKERRAIFERYQSNEAIGEDQQLEHTGGTRSRTGSSAAVIKSRSESNVGFVNGSTGRFELALNQLKRNDGGGADYCCEDSGIQSTTDLSRSSVVSQADDSGVVDPSLLLLIPTDEGVGKSPARSVTLDSASEFSDTECSNGQLLDNALDVAFEEMDSELNESCLLEDRTEQAATGLPDTETPPLGGDGAIIVPLTPDYEPTADDDAFSDEQIVPLALPASTLTPPKEKPPPPPVDDEPDVDFQPLTTGTVAVAAITSWMQKNATTVAMETNGNGTLHPNDDQQPSRDLYEPTVTPRRGDNAAPVRPEDLFRLADDQWRNLESYEVVQQVQHQQQQKQRQHEQEKEQELDKDQQELLVYSNRIETLPQHHQLYDAGEHEEMVSVERELLQIEQEELQRRREKQMFYDKLTKADTTRTINEQQQHQQHQHQQLPNQVQQQSQPLQQQQHQQQRQLQQQQQQHQQPYYYAHHHSHQPHHHHHHHLHHHRASMPAMDSRSLQNVASYASFETPFLDDVNTYEMGSLHRESMPNLSNVAAAASSSHPSSLSSYGEELSTHSAATSFDGGCWPPVEPHRPAARPTVAPRPTMNGFLPPGIIGFPPSGSGGGQRLSSNNVFEQHPKDSKQNAPHPTMVTRGQVIGTGGVSSMPYGQHWLVQEAEQRRIEQHQKSNANNAKRPLPKFVIDAITQRVQKLNAGSPEHSDRSNLSEDSDLAMINSMKHHHPHHQQSLPAVSHHHQQQQPLPTQQQQQQKYSNASDKVLSVSGKKECSHCRIELGKGAAMAIESLGLFYHIECFKCCVCHVKLGDGTNGIDVRVRKYRLHCQNCFSSEDGVKFSCV